MDESERAFVTPTVPVYPCGPAEKRKGEPTTPCKHLCSLQEERFAKSAPRVADLERRIFQAAAHSFAARRAGGSDWGPIPWLHAMGADSGGEVGGRESTRGSTLQKVSSGPLPWMVTRGHAMWRDLSWREASGSLGDLGTFLPLLVGLTVESGLDVGTTLITTGVYNLITGMVFDVPMPVQPMKTIAAVALSDASLTMPQIISAGVFVSAVVFFLGATGLIDRFNDFTPKAVVHGMQIGLGVLLCVKAFTMSLFVDGDGGDGDYVIRTFLGADGLLLCACSLVLATVPLVWKIGKQARCDDETDEENADGRELVGDGTGNRGSAAVTGNTEPAGENTETETSASEVTVEEGIDIDATVGEKKDEGVDSSTVRSTREKKNENRNPPAHGVVARFDRVGRVHDPVWIAYFAQNRPVHAGAHKNNPSGFRFRNRKSRASATAAHHVELRGGGVRAFQGLVPRSPRDSETSRDFSRGDELNRSRDRRDAGVSRRGRLSRALPLRRPARRGDGVSGRLQAFLWRFVRRLNAIASEGVPENRARRDARRSERGAR